MAAYKNADFFTQQTGPAFDFLHKPGMPVPVSGIYKCSGCGDEIACNKGDPFPPQNHHQHRDPRMFIRWRLIAAAIQLRATAPVFANHVRTQPFLSGLTR
jgi:hypothetical protein